MGDRSPKAIEQKKKQAEAEKKKQQADGTEVEEIIWKRASSLSPEEILSAFRNSYFPRIAVTVDMIATGTDIKPLEIVFFMRSVGSRNFFDQMKGRGVRVISPDDLKGVTPDAKAKARLVAFQELCLSHKVDWSRLIVDEYLSGRVGRVDIVRSVFISTLAQKPQISTLLPVASLHVSTPPLQLSVPRALIRLIRKRTPGRLVSPTIWAVKLIRLMSEPLFDVIIVGAGPAGLAAAD